LLAAPDGPAFGKTGEYAAATATATP